MNIWTGGYGWINHHGISKTNVSLNTLQRYKSTCQVMLCRKIRCQEFFTVRYQKVHNFQCQPKIRRKWGNESVAAADRLKQCNNTNKPPSEFCVLTVQIGNKMDTRCPTACSRFFFLLDYLPPRIFKVTIDDVIIPSLISFHEKWAFRMRFFLIFREVDTLYFVLIGAVSKYYNNLEKLALIITS